MRVDVNVSVMHKDGTFSERVEVKNVAGAKNVERAVEHEFLRHINMIKEGKMPHMETRRYDAENDKTLPIRMKEEDPDYRFFLDPDLPAFRVEE